MNFQLGFFWLIFSKILVIAHDDLVPPNKLDLENPSAGKPSLYEHHCKWEDTKKKFVAPLTTVVKLNVIML